MKVYVAAYQYFDWNGNYEGCELQLLNYPYETIVKLASQKGFNTIYFEAELI